MKKLTAMAVVIAAMFFQNAKAQKIFDQLDRLSDKVDRASNKVDRAGNSVDRAGKTADKAVSTGGKIVSIFKKKEETTETEAVEDTKPRKTKTKSKK